MCFVSRGLMVAGRSRAAAVTEASDVERERRQSTLANTSKMSRTQATGGKGEKLEKRIGEDADSQGEEAERGQERRPPRGDADGEMERCPAAPIYL